MKILKKNNNQIIVSTHHIRDFEQDTFPYKIINKTRIKKTTKFRV